LSSFSKWFVYVDFRSDTNKPFYVGKGNDARVKRITRNRYHSSIVKKYGFQREIVFSSNDEQLCFLIESHLICELKTRNCFGGANFTDGGDGVSGLKHSQISNENNRLKHIGKVQDQNACQRKSNSMKSSLKVKRIRVKQLALSGDLIKIHDSVSSAANSLNKPNASSLISRCCRKKTKTFNGFRWEYDDSVEIKSNTRKYSKVRKVVQYDSESSIIHDSISSAARSINKNTTSIRLCCHNKRETAYGFMWKFV
jgi:hypothetical protein